MDSRFIRKDHVIMLVGLIEMFFMGPMCLYIARLFLSTRSIKLYLLVLIISVVQIFGTIMFVGSEIMANFEDYCK